MVNTATATPALTAILKTQPNLHDNEQAAAHIGVTPRTLEVWRCVKRHDFPYIKVGRLVKYRLTDLDAWLESRTVSDDAA
jgi:excisionase family DNA binding protein